MTSLNDLILTQCYLETQDALKKLRESQDLEEIRKEWDRIFSAAKTAGERYNHLRFRNAPLPDGYRIVA